MSVYFAMVEGLPTFYLTEKQAPDGATKVTEKRFAQLLDAQSEGHAIKAGKSGQPIIQKAKPNAAALRVSIERQVKREARRRIEEISPIWRQLNDNRKPSAEGDARFAKIDAIREASEAIAAVAQDLPAAKLSELSIGNHPLWPEFD